MIHGFDSPRSSILPLDLFGHQGRKNLECLIPLPCHSLTVSKKKKNFFCCVCVPNFSFNRSHEDLSEGTVSLETRLQTSYSTLITPFTTTTPHSMNLFVPDDFLDRCRWISLVESTHVLFEVPPHPRIQIYA